MRIRIILAVAALASVFTGVAVAHVTENKGWVIRENANCVWNHTELDHPSGYKMSSRIVIESWREWPVGGAACLYHFSRPPGYLAMRRVTWVGRDGNSLVCSSTGWVYNGTTEWTWTTRVHWTSLPCGGGYYGHQGGTYMYNGSWKGGWQWSGWHWL